MSPSESTIPSKITHSPREGLLDIKPIVDTSSFSLDASSLLNAFIIAALLCLLLILKKWWEGSRAKTNIASSTTDPILLLRESLSNYVTAKDNLKLPAVELSSAIKLALASEVPGLADAEGYTASDLIKYKEAQENTPAKEAILLAIKILNLLELCIYAPQQNLSNEQHRHSIELTKSFLEILLLQKKEKFANKALNNEANA